MTESDSQWSPAERVPAAFDLTKFSAAEVQMLGRAVFSHWDSLLWGAPRPEPPELVAAQDAASRVCAMLTVSLGALANTAPEHGAEILRTLTATDNDNDAELAVKAAPAYLATHYELACDTLAHAWAFDTDVSEEASNVFYSIRNGEEVGVTQQQLAEIEARLLAIDEARW